MINIDHRNTVKVWWYIFYKDALSSLIWTCGAKKCRSISSYFWSLRDQKSFSVPAQRFFLCGHFEPNSFLPTSNQAFLIFFSISSISVRRRLPGGSSDKILSRIENKLWWCFATIRRLEVSWMVRSCPSTSIGPWNNLNGLWIEDELRQLSFFWSIYKWTHIRSWFIFSKSFFILCTWWGAKIVTTLSLFLLMKM